MRKRRETTPMHACHLSSGKVLLGVFSVVPSCSKATWLSWAGFLLWQYEEDVAHSPTSQPAGQPQMERPFSPGRSATLLDPRGPVSGWSYFHRLKWYGWEIIWGKWMTKLRLWNLKQMLQRFPRMRLVTLVAIRAQGLDSWFPPTQCILWARSLYLGSIFCKVGLVTPWVVVKILWDI